jgi:transcriptional regulator with XRE-family HTH domain
MLASWIRAQRERESLTIRALSEATRIDIATISRLENALSQPTLSTAVRLCDGLGSSFNSILPAVSSSAPPPEVGEDSSILKDSGVLTMQDIGLFFKVFRDEREEANSLLFNLLDRIQRLQQATTNIRPRSEFPLSGDKIEVLIENSPLLFVYLQYPPINRPQFYREIYHSGGVLISEDARAYLRICHEAQQSSDLGNSALSRVFSRVDQTAFERIKFLDVINLDEAHEAHGLIAGVYWYACKFQQSISEVASNVVRISPYDLQIDQYYRLAKLLVITCRWLQWLLPNDDGWKAEFKKTFSPSTM